MLNRLYRCTTLLTLAALFCGARPQPTPATGPAALKLMSLEELSSIEVTTPSKEPEPVMKVPAAIYVITGEDIRRSGATNIPDALRLAPGVEVARIDGNKYSVGIRGFGSRLSRSVLVLMDGRTVYNPPFAGTDWEVQDTFIDDIDRIEVIRGPGGTIWGPNAVNGVINVITKAAGDTRGIRASAVGGNEEQGGAAFRYGGGNGGTFNYRFYAQGFNRAPESHPDGRNFDDWRSAQGGFRADWKRSDRDTFTVQGDLYAQRTGERVTTTIVNPPLTRNVEGNADLSGGNILARWDRTNGNDGDIQAQVYYDRTNRDELNYADYRNTYDVDFLQRLRAPARQRISWGVGARLSTVDNPLVITGLRFDPFRRIDWLVSAFLQDEIELVTNRVSLTVGTKLLRTNYTGAQFEPSARLLWTLSQRDAFWASYTHAVRTPSAVEENFFPVFFRGPDLDRCTVLRAVQSQSEVRAGTAERL
jgi:iron complex outermembrane receptor protein